MSESESTLDNVQSDTEQKGTMATGSKAASKMTAEEVYQAVKKLVTTGDGMTVKAATKQVAEQTGRNDDTVRETYYRRGRLDKQSAIKSRKQPTRRGGPAYERMTEGRGAKVNGTTRGASRAKAATAEQATVAEFNAAIEQAMDALDNLIGIAKKYRDDAQMYQEIRERFVTSG